MIGLSTGELTIDLTKISAKILLYLRNLYTKASLEDAE